MENRTIEEKINKMVFARLQDRQSKIGYNECINIEYFATDCAIEQDRIARQEERERCVKAACNVFCNELCTKYDECKIGYYEVCEKQEKIRKAMEGGEE